MRELEEKTLIELINRLSDIKARYREIENEKKELSKEVEMIGQEIYRRFPLEETKNLIEERRVKI